MSEASNDFEEITPTLAQTLEGSSFQQFLTEFLPTVASEDIGTRFPSLVSASEITLAALSREKKTESEETKASVFMKLSVQDLWQLRQEGKSPEEIKKKLDETTLCYAVAVALPKILMAQEPVERERNFKFFVESCLQSKTIQLDPSQRQEYQQFTRTRDEFLASARAEKQGIWGEFLTCCFLDKIGLQTQLSSPRKDRRGVDLYAQIPHTLGNGQVEISSLPVQVKTDSRSATNFVHITGRPRQPILIALNTSMIDEDPELVAALLSDDSVTQSHHKIEEFKGLLDVAIKKRK